MPFSNIRPPLLKQIDPPHSLVGWLFFPRSSEEVLSVNGAKFINWNRGVGRGTIDLVIHLQRLDFKAAVNWLAQHFHGMVNPMPQAPTPQANLAQALLY